MLDAALQAVPRVRRTDPGTSYAAAELAGTLASRHKRAILEALDRQKEPVGATRLAALAGLTQVQVCRRLPELLAINAVRIRGESLSASGRPERGWEIVRPGDGAL